MNSIETPMGIRILAGIILVIVLVGIGYGAWYYNTHKPYLMVEDADGVVYRLYDEPARKFQGPVHVWSSRFYLSVITPAEMKRTNKYLEWKEQNFMDGKEAHLRGGKYEIRLKEYSGFGADYANEPYATWQMKIKPKSQK